jgi:hypothetical protein
MRADSRPPTRTAARVPFTDTPRLTVRGS